MRISPVVRSALVVYATLKRKMAEGVLTRGFALCGSSANRRVLAAHPFTGGVCLSDHVQNTLNCPDGVKPGFPNSLFAALTCKLKANWTFVDIFRPKLAKLAHLPSQ